MSPVNNARDLLNSVISLEILVTDNIPPDGVLLNKKKTKKRGKRKRTTASHNPNAY